MSAVRPPDDPGAEREIDLRRWRDALFAYWWIALAGLVVGVLAGSVYSLSGGTTYSATALIARGQAFNPGGTTPVLSYLSSPSSIQAYATEPTTIAAVAAKTGMTPATLRGHVSIATVGETGTASQQNTNSILIQITVTANKAKKAEDAANGFAEVIKQLTTTDYVRQSISIYENRIASFNKRLETVSARISALTDSLKQPNVDLNTKLLLTIQLDQAEATYGQTSDSLTNTQQLLSLARDVEQTKVVQPASRAQKSQARSRRNSVVVGAVIGLVLGAIVATFAGLRRPRPAAA